MAKMRKIIASVAVGLLASGSSVAISQQAPNRFQPYTPTVVGGLPPGSKGLEQPVYVAERMPANQPIKATDGLGPEFLTASNLGFNEAQFVPSTDSMDRFEAGMLVAVVGEEPVLVGDLFPPSKLTAKVLGHSQFELQLRKELMEAVTRKSLAQKFLNDKVSGKPVKDRADAKKQMNTQTTKIFHQKWKPMQMEKMKCESDLEFEEKLAEAGKTLQSMMRDFAENTWAQEHVREKVPENPNVELSEMSDYFNDHIDDYKRPSRVRFQMLSADFAKFPTKEAAYKAIADMGNQILLGGAPFAAVAKRQSTGLGASDGGLFDWTNQGELKSKEIDKAIFENPVKGLSQIIENSSGYHIVEVLEREQARTQTFVEVQADIRKKRVEQKHSKLRNDFIKKVREETPIWTKWPEDIPGSRDISELQQ
jgi:parvulin-like peptidyl-prolyl isomerase